MKAKDQLSECKKMLQLASEEKKAMFPELWALVNHMILEAEDEDGVSNQTIDDVIEQINILLNKEI